jgi:hypothetical protein
MMNKEMSENNIDFAYKVVKLLDKYSDHDIVQTILHEAFDNKEIGNGPDSPIKTNTKSTHI